MSQSTISENPFDSFFALAQGETDYIIFKIIDGLVRLHQKHRREWLSMTNGRLIGKRWQH
jgi:hypothetical protein